MRVTNILLWVQENKLSEKFYKKLGFDVVRSDDTHSVVRLNDFELMLVNMRDETEFAKDSMSSEKVRGVYIYVAVDDVDVAYEKMKARGFKPHSEPRNWEWGNREFILKDPDGYKLCFWKELKETNAEG